MKNRIVILGNTGNNPFTAYSWFCRTVAEGFYLNGYEVLGLNYKTHTIKQIRDFLFSCDAKCVFTHLTMHKHHNKFDIMEIFDELRSLMGTTIIHTLSDARSEPRYKGDISHAFDFALISTYNNVKKFQKYWKVPVYYWPYSGLTYEKMGAYKKNLDFEMPVFPGNPNSHEDRNRFIRKLQSKLEFKIIQTKSPQDIRHRTLDFCMSAPAILCLSTRYEFDNGFSDVRDFQYGCGGGIMIGRPHNITKKIIPDNLWFTFDSYDNKGVEKVKELWNKINKLSDAEKNKMRENVFNFFQKHHSSKVRMAQTIELIKGKRDKLDIFLEDIGW